MKVLLLRGLTAPLLAGALLLSACKKDDKPVPAPPSPPVTTGSIDGQILPATAVAAIIATNTATTTTVTAAPAANGTFTLGSLAPGAYSVRFVPAAGFATPTGRTATVVAGEASHLGNVVVNSGTGATGSCVFNNNPYLPVRIQGTLVGNQLSVTLYNNGSGALGIVLNDVSAATPFIYPLVSANHGRYFLTIPGSPCGEWTTYFGGAGGTSTITYYNATTRRVSGTFSFDAHQNSTGLSCGQPVTVTAGIFTDVPF